MTLSIFTDGASRGNPGKASIGAVILENGIIIDQISKYIGEKTNNEAEYTAVLESLKWMIEHKYTNARFYADSKLLVEQLNGNYKVKAPTIIPLFKECKELIKDLSVSFTWVRREENSQADALANQALDSL